MCSSAFSFCVFGSSATETWQEATVFLLAVVEVFTVPFMRVWCGQKTLHLMASRIFSFVCGWLLCGCSRQTEEREGGGEGEKSSGYMHFLKATWMSSCFLLICALKTSVSPHLWQTSVLIHVTVCFAYFLCVFFDTSLCVHRWMWTYLTVVGFFFLFIHFINFVWEGTILFCGCGIEHLVRWQLGVTEMKGQWVVCCDVLDQHEMEASDDLPG